MNVLQSHWQSTGLCVCVPTNALMYTYIFFEWNKRNEAYKT